VLAEQQASFKQQGRRNSRNKKFKEDWCKELPRLRFNYSMGITSYFLVSQVKILR
jgi:hypothetical protein